MKPDSTKLWYISAFPRPFFIWLVVMGWAVFAISFLLISGGSMIKTMAPPSGSNMDKLIHAGAYAVLTAGLVFAWPKRSLLIIFCISVGFGAIIEVLQHTVATGRTGSLADAAANGVGALAIILIWMGVCPLLKHYPALRD